MSVKPSLCLTRRWPEAVQQRLAERYELTTNEADQPLSEGALGEALQTYDALGVTVTDLLNAKVLRGLVAPKTRILANFGVGFNHIDLPAARDLGLTVTNTPGVLTDATADLAMTLLLSVARRSGEGERLLRAGCWSGWSPTHLLSTQVTGKTLGIVGMGRIGRAMAARAALGFNMRVLYCSRSPLEAPLPFEARRCDLSTLLGAADFVSLHCPSTAQTHHLIDRAALQAMQPSAFLINTARGDVVDEFALVSALEAGEIAGAGLDVYVAEPHVTSGLLNREDVVLLPHQGSGTRETREAMGMCAADNLDAFFAGRRPPNQVV